MRLFFLALLFLGVGHAQSFYPPITYSNGHHWLIGVTVSVDDTCQIELEDNSVWKITSSNGTNVLNWRITDPLTLTQVNGWCSSYYRITNKAEGTSVDVDLFLGPKALGPYSRFITAIDADRREVWLSDHTHWSVSHLDTSVFRTWALNDYLIIGTNTYISFWDSTADTLLINANMNNSARAKQF